MINVISSEFYKIFRSRIFYIVSGILLFLNVVVCGQSIYAKYSTKYTAVQKAQMMAGGIEMYRDSFSQDLVFYIILLFTAYIITSEYTNKSIRQMASHGIARWKLVLGQYVAVSCVITLMMVCFGLINLVIDTMLNGLGTVDGGVFVRFQVAIICMFWGVSGIAVFLSYLFKNSVAAIIISMLFVMGSNIIVSLIADVIQNKEINIYTLSDMRKVIVNFNSAPNDVMNFAVIFLIIGAVCVALSSLIFSKSDIH